MNRTSKRIICLSVQSLDQPSISPVSVPWHPKLAPTSRREFAGLHNTICAGLKTLAERDSRRFRNPLRRFYKAPAVAKLGLLRRDAKTLSV
jgi:hypothetical protein